MNKIRLLLFNLTSPIFFRVFIQAENIIHNFVNKPLMVEVSGLDFRKFGEKNLNIGSLENLDLISYAHVLPYKYETVDCITCSAVLKNFA